MPYAQYLRKNHRGTRYPVAVHIPPHLRQHFNGRAKLRRSTGTPDRIIAKRRSDEFWLKCQSVFESLENTVSEKPEVIRTGYAIALLGPVDWGGDKDPEAAKREEEEARRIERFAIEHPELFKKALTARSASTSPAQNQG